MQIVSKKTGFRTRKIKRLARSHNDTQTPYNRDRHAGHRASRNAALRHQPPVSFATLSAQMVDGLKETQLTSSGSRTLSGIKTYQTSLERNVVKMAKGSFYEEAV